MCLIDRWPSWQKRTASSCVGLERDSPISWSQTLSWMRFSGSSSARISPTNCTLWMTPRSATRWVPLVSIYRSISFNVMWQLWECSLCWWGCWSWICSRLWRKWTDSPACAPSCLWRRWGTAWRAAVTPMMFSTRSYEVDLLDHRSVSLNGIFTLSLQHVLGSTALPVFPAAQTSQTCGALSLPP